MDLEYYGLFLVGAILVSLGIVVIALAALLINHLYTKYWKSVQLFRLYNFEEEKMPTEVVSNNDIKSTKTV